jgi:hypothetical protein
VEKCKSEKVEAKKGRDVDGWKRVGAKTGRYEYQFQGSGPCVRAGRYEDATDFQFLLMDETGWLYRIPVRISAEALTELVRAQATADEARAAELDPGRIAEMQLRAGLENFRPRENAPYEEMDGVFAVEVRRARELAKL